MLSSFVCSLLSSFTCCSICFLLLNRCNFCVILRYLIMEGRDISVLALLGNCIHKISLACRCCVNGTFFGTLCFAIRVRGIRSVFSKLLGCLLFC